MPLTRRYSEKVVAFPPPVGYDGVVAENPTRERKGQDVRIISEAPIEGAKWEEGFGEAPLSRADGGQVATGQHGTCQSCWFPTPIRNLKDGICGTCRGEEVSFERFTSHPKGNQATK